MRAVATGHVNEAQRMIDPSQSTLQLRQGSAPTEPAEQVSNTLRDRAKSHACTVLAHDTPRWELASGHHKDAQEKE